MAAFINNDITTAGLIVLAKGVAGQKINYTKIVLGDGYLEEGQTPRTLTGVVSPKATVDITKLKINGDGTVAVGGIFTNGDETEGFYYRELGLYAEDPDPEVGEVLYCYGNCGDLAEWIPPSGGATIVEKTIDIVTAIGTLINMFVSCTIAYPLSRPYLKGRNGFINMVIVTMLFTGGMVSMIIGYTMLALFSSNLPVVIVALIFFYVPAQFIQMTAILSLTDSIEYGQLKNGRRNEAVTLSVRPMLDKIGGAMSNGAVGAVALAAGMTGHATAADMTASNIATFKTFAFYVPLVLIILSLVVFWFKVKIDEKMHAQIVEELEAKLASGEIVDDEAQAVIKN